MPGSISEGTKNVGDCRPGRPAKAKPGATVEERRFSAAVSDQIREGFSPRRIDTFEICGSPTPNAGSRI